MLNEGLVKELRAVNGISERDRFFVMCEGHAAAEYIVHFWNLRHPRTVNDSIRAVVLSIDATCSKFGNAVTCISLASTIVLGEMGCCFSLRAIEWAEAVMDVWTNRTNGTLRAVAIRPQLCSSEFAYALTLVML